eukprot:tig00020875_g14899.t1
MVDVGSRLLSSSDSRVAGAAPDPQQHGVRCPPEQRVTCRGSWDDWKHAIPLEPNQHSVYVASVDLPFGVHSYKIEAGREQYVVCEDRPNKQSPCGRYVNNVLNVRPPIAVVYESESGSDRAFIVLSALRARGLYAVAASGSAELSSDAKLQLATAAVLVHVAGAREVGELARAWQLLAARGAGVILVSDGEPSAARDALLPRGGFGLAPEPQLLPWPRNAKTLAVAVDVIVDAVLQLPPLPPGCGSPAAAPSLQPPPAPVKTANPRARAPSPFRSRPAPGVGSYGGARPRAPSPWGDAVTARPTSAAAVAAAAAAAAAAPIAEAKPCVRVVPVLATESALAAEGGVAQQAVRLMESVAGGRFSFELRPFDADAPGGGAGAGHGAAVLLGTGEGPRISDALHQALRAIRGSSSREAVLIVLRNSYDAAKVDDYPSAGEHCSGVLNGKPPRRAVLRLVHYEGRLREDDARGVENLKTLAELLAIALPPEAAPAPARSNPVAASGSFR